MEVPQAAEDGPICTKPEETTIGLLESTDDFPKTFFILLDGDFFFDVPSPVIKGKGLFSYLTEMKA